MQFSTGGLAGREAWTTCSGGSPYMHQLQLCNRKPWSLSWSIAHSPKYVQASPGPPDAGSEGSVPSAEGQAGRRPGPPRLPVSCPWRHRSFYAHEESTFSQHLGDIQNKNYVCARWMKKMKLWEVKGRA